MTQQHHLNHANMGLQISCGFHTEVPEESGPRENQEEPRCGFPRFGAAAQMPDPGHLMTDRRWVGIRRQSGPTSGARSFRIAKWINLR